MIHMLSRFDLKPKVSLDAFNASYHQLVEDMRAEGLVEGTGRIGRREKNTPMDTDDETAPEYYVVMSFRDREQLNASYAYMEQVGAGRQPAHRTVFLSVTNSVFTCWEDVD